MKDELLNKIDNIVTKRKNVPFVTVFKNVSENNYNWMDNLWLKEENIVAKGEIACFEHYIFKKLSVAEASLSV